jgi:hypothetical protein
MESHRFMLRRFHCRSALVVGASPIVESPRGVTFLPGGAGAV